MALGWSARVDPRKSTSVSVRILGRNMRKLIGVVVKYLRHVPSWPPRVADNLNTNLVQVIEVFIREMEEFAPFVLIHSWVRAGGGD